jgi:hypothetical protein
MASPLFRIPQVASAVQFLWPANPVDSSWLSPQWVEVRTHFRHDPVDHLDGDKRINAEIGNDCAVLTFSTTADDCDTIFCTSAVHISLDVSFQRLALCKANQCVW